MLRRNRYRKIPPNPNRKKRRERKSNPLQRSVHIEEERWGWEYAFKKRKTGEMCDCKSKNDKCIFCERVNEKIKIISPDNKYIEVKAEEFYVTREWECGQKYLDTTITPGMVKQYILDKIVNRNVAQSGSVLR